MAMPKNFMGLDGFIWFTGVVEDRDDPSKLGRVKVRCLGFHTEDKVDIPTADLPWAHVMHPVTDPSMQGLGNTPTFLVEGSWVVGFFRDPEYKQQPIVMGSLPGIPETVADKTKGFNDPNARYPNTEIPHSTHTTSESDTSRLARGGADAETHQSLINRRKEREDITSIPIATKPNFGEDGISTTFTTEDTRKTWDQPHPQGIPSSTSKYPYNHVFESESGHIIEIDDTSGNERLHREHRTGTFEEIHADGSRVTRIVENDYEIVYSDKNVFIGGTVNLTIGGNVNHLIQGDYVQEVEGNYTLKVGKGMFTKIGAIKGGNYELDILGGHSFRIQNSVSGMVGMEEGSSDIDYDITIKGNESRNVGGIQQNIVVGNAIHSSNNMMTIVGKTNLALLQSNILGVMTIQANGKLNTRITGTVTETFASTLSSTVTGAVTETYGSTQATTASGNITITGGPRIDLNP